MWGKLSPRGDCVGRYPFEREVSRNALNFQSSPGFLSAFAKPSAHLPHLPIEAFQTAQLQTAPPASSQAREASPPPQSPHLASLRE